MIEQIESIMERYFPEQWNAENITHFIGKPRFIRDDVALDRALNQPIREFLFRGGKRMRPLLFLTLLKGFGKDPARYLDFALLIELVHNGTLVIDDIEDGALVRRGKPALHEIFDIDIAINAGVAMHILPLRVLMQENSLLTDQQRVRLYSIYSEEMIHVYSGQALDIYWHKHLPIDITREQYLEMARLKTGSLARMAVRFASVLAEQDQIVEQSLTYFAEAAATAFQIKDDVLDITGEQEKFGKAIGGDITEGKMSLPLILAMERLSDDKKQQLRAILLQHTRDQVLIKQALSLIIQTDAIERALQYAAELLQNAWHGVESKIPDGEGRQLLQELTESLVKRDH